jgi:hypothetical protein
MEWYIVDVWDDVILFEGTLEQCKQEIDKMCGGLSIVHKDELSENNKRKV